MIKNTKLASVNIASNGFIEIKLSKQIVEDDVVISEEPHRTGLNKGDDIDTQMQIVNEHLSELKFPPVSAEDIEKIKTLANAAWG